LRRSKAMANPTRAAAVNPDTLPENPVQAGIKDALIGGAIAFGLFVLLIGLETTQNIRNELVINQRWGLLSWMISIVMGSRFIMTSVIYPLLHEFKTGKISCRKYMFQPNFARTTFYVPFLLTALAVLGYVLFVTISKTLNVTSAPALLEWIVKTAVNTAAVVAIEGGVVALLIVVTVVCRLIFNAIFHTNTIGRQSSLNIEQTQRIAGSPSKFSVFIYKYGNLIVMSVLLALLVGYVIANPSATGILIRLSTLAGIFALFVVKELISLNAASKDEENSSLSIAPLRESFKKKLQQNGLISLFFYPAVVVAMVGLVGSLKWVDNFGIQILIYVMLAWGLNIVVGLAGLLDLGYVAFYAVGAYSYALLSDQFGLSFWILLPVAGILAAFWGVILGFPVLRLRGDYLAIVTLAFGEIIRLVLINWTAVTKGTFGVSGIQKATLFGIEFNASPTGFAAVMHLTPSSAYYKIFLYYLILLLCLLTAFVTIRLRRMPIGRAWEALREDEIACRSLGINTTTTKLTAFATGAMFGGFAGAFFAVRQGFVSPESFVFIESAVILAIVVLGGMGSLPGIAIAATVMIGGTELLRELDFLKTGEVFGLKLFPGFGSDFTPELYRMLLFGLAMVVVMLWKPRGFVGTREPTAFLKSSKAVSGAFTKEGHG
jgi:branched-chain amino acid transport system permease protein